MMLRSEPVVITGYGKWDIGGKVATYKDGTEVEAVEFQVPGESQARKVTLDPGINGSRPAVGTTVTIDLELRPHEEARVAAGGRPYIHRRDKQAARAFHPAK